LSDLGEQWRLWPDPDRGPWVIVTTWTEIDGKAECVGLTLRSYRQDGNPWEATIPERSSARRTVTTALLRRLRLKDLFEAARREMEATSAFGPAKEQSHQGWTREARYAHAAAVYTAAIPTGAPTAAVARELRLSPAAARSMVNRARRDGYLPPVSTRD
jgi:hypothetical protein